MTSQLKFTIPKLASLDIERSLAFYERSGFERSGLYPGHGIVKRDDIRLHFWLCSDARIPKETGCRIEVEGIGELFKEFSAQDVIHPNSRLEDKPWGVREFSILDTDGNLLTFQQSS